MGKEDFIQDSCNNSEKLSSIPIETKSERDFNHQHEPLETIGRGGKLVNMIRPSVSAIWNL